MTQQQQEPTRLERVFARATQYAVGAGITDAHGWTLVKKDGLWHIDMGPRGLWLLGLDGERGSIDLKRTTARLVTLTYAWSLCAEQRLAEELKTKRAQS